MKPEVLSFNLRDCLSWKASRADRRGTCRRAVSIVNFVGLYSTNWILHAGLCGYLETLYHNQIYEAADAAFYLLSNSSTEHFIRLIPYLARQRQAALLLIH